MKRAPVCWTLTILLAAPAALTAQTEPQQTQRDTGSTALATALASRQEPRLSHESQEALAETEERVTGLERRIDRLEARSRSLGLEITELQLRELRFSRSRNTARTREAERRTLAETLDELNRNITRLTTLMTILIEQHQPEDEPGPPPSSEPEADR